MNNQTDQKYAILTHDLSFQWPGDQPALAFPDISLRPGEHLFLRGASGTGKSTLLSLIGGLLSPRSGQIHLLGHNLGELGPGRRDRFRADHMGVIFQQFNLVPYLSTLANVTLPCRLSNLRNRRATPSPEAAARALLTHLAIPESHWHQKITRLSVGQQQRVAAARSLIGAPPLILADEPTSALDTDNRDRFIELLLTLANENGTSVVFVSHDQSLAGRFDRQQLLEATP